ncbi:methyl-accepting chemotaxis protein [Geotoga petraea]|uniref:Fibronectin type-III domain-containing protein n=1 Tax=Geotoga petraea TaxID=28234 RepID=A0A1G6LU69_9BACT|nr:methyl-accepting chemotaxis protein [Geotoga petraea]SDC46749.1 hypothetical protein SAMN04488588_1146 [Geotoga petraea]
MFPPISYDNSFLEYIRKPTRNKKIKVLAKIDGTNFYDISEYVQKITTNNKIELLEDPAIDNAKITVANKNNMFTKTQFNDVFDPSVGKFNGTVEQNYLNKEWEIKIYVEISNEDANKIAIPLFTGIKPVGGITEKHKKAEIVVKDILHYAINKELTYPLLYPNYTPNNIISDLLTRAGIAVENQDFQSLTTPFEVYITEENTTVWRNILKIIKGTQARFSVTPEGKVIYRTKIENFYDPDIALSIDADKIQEYELLGDQKYNKIKVESEGYKIDTYISKIINVELQDDENRTIKKGEIETFDFEYKSDFAKDVANTVFISYSSPNTEGIAYDSAFSLNDSDSNIKINKFDIRPDKLILEIENLNTSIDILIDALKLDGRQINKVSLENLVKVNNTGFPDKEYAIKSFYSTKAMLSNIADVAENLISKDIVFELSLNEFYPELYAGNLINLTLPEKGISNGTFIVNSVTHKIEGSTYKTNITITEYKDVVFNINDKEYEKINTGAAPGTGDQIDFIQGEVEELKGDVEDQKQKTDFLDSNAPAKPTNFSLQTQFLNKRSVIKMSCDENTETDLIGYEFQWSYDQINWNSIQSKDNLAQAEVQGNITVYARVRALDAEGNASLFTNILSVTTAKDSTAPATPTGISVTPNYAGVVFKLIQNTEEDFKEYKLTINTVEYVFSNNYIVISGLQPETTYNYSIVAIDYSENESTAATGSFTTERKAASEEAIDNINGNITNINTDINTINSDITSLNTNVSNINTDIDTIQVNINGMNTDITNINENITSIETTQGQIQTTVSNHGTRLDTAETDITTNASQITQNADEISSLVTKTGVNDLGETETLSSKISQNATSITSAVSRIDTAENDISNNNNAISTNATQITQNADNITQLVTKTGINNLGETETLISEITQNADNITSMVGILNSTPGATNQYTAIKQNADSITTAVSRIDTNETDISSNSSLITQNATSISSTVQRLNDVDGNGTSMENSISAIVQNADEISSTVEGIKYKYALSVPEGAIAYWSDSLFDKINGLTPEGYTETWQPYEKTLSTIAQHSDEISQRIVAKDMDTGEVLRNTELLISDGKIQVIASMFEVLGDAIVNGTISADKLSSLILEAGKYIQVGDSNNGYKLDGTTGLSRLIGGQEKKIPSILQRDIVSFDSNETQKAITLNPNASSENSYNVILNAVNFKYWDENFQTQQKRYLTQHVSNKNASGFVINAYTVISNTNIKRSDSVTISSDSTFTLVSNLLNILKARVVYSNLEFLYDYGTATSTTITISRSSSVNSTTFVTTQNITVNFGNGGSITKSKSINPSVDYLWEQKLVSLNTYPLDTGKINLGTFTGNESVKQISIDYGYLSNYNSSSHTQDDYIISFDSNLQGTIEVKVKTENYNGYEADLYAYIYKNSSLIKTVLIKSLDFEPDIVTNHPFDVYSVDYTKETKTAQNPSYTADLTDIWTGATKQSAEADIEYVVIGY